jgi:hypothetical protein
VVADDEAQGGVRCWWVGRRRHDHATSKPTTDYRCATSKPTTDYRCATRKPAKGYRCVGGEATAEGGDGAGGHGVGRLAEGDEVDGSAERRQGSDSLARRGLRHRPGHGRLEEAAEHLAGRSDHYAPAFCAVLLTAAPRSV